MHTRPWARWIWLLATVWTSGGAVIGCGSSGATPSAVDGGGTVPDASIGGWIEGGALEDHIVTVTPDGGSGFFHDSSVGQCVPKTCAQLRYDCGANVDGCGGTIDCGVCTGNDRCGGGGFSVCGLGNGGSDSGAEPDATVQPCIPKSCMSAGYDCGLDGRRMRRDS